MRYRSLGSGKAAVSVVTLALDNAVAERGEEGARALLYAALEHGINSFHIDSLDPVLVRVIGEALSHIERDLLFISLTVGPLPNGRRDFTLEGIDAVLTAVLEATQLQYFDAIILDDPDNNELPTSAIKGIRNDERVHQLGIRGNSEVMDIYVGSSLFDVLHTACHIQLNAKERSRMRDARERDMTIFGTTYYPDTLFAPPPPPPPPPGRNIFGIKKKPIPVEMPRSPFDFLRRTPGWEAEDLCLAHALLDTSLSSIVIHANMVEDLVRLVAASERSMPVSMPAQLEMARVGKVEGLEKDKEDKEEPAEAASV